MSEAERNLELVKMVEEYPCLYNINLKEYSRKDLVDKAWAEISKRIKWKDSECKEKWRNMRNGFVRSIKISGKSKRPYYLHDAMKFVIPYLKKNLEIDITDRDGKRNPQKEQDNKNEDFVYTDELSPSIQSSYDSDPDEIFPSLNVSHYKRKISTDGSKTEKIKGDTDNPRKMFLLSLLPDIEKLSDSNMRLLKIDIMTLIQTYHEAQEGLAVIPHPRLISKSQKLQERLNCSVASTTQRNYPATKTPKGYVTREDILLKVVPPNESMRENNTDESITIEPSLHSLQKWEHEDE